MEEKKRRTLIEIFNEIWEDITKEKTDYKKELET